MSGALQLPLGIPFGSSPSFTELVAHDAAGGAARRSLTDPPFPVPHGTTVLGLKFEGGMLMAGDRRATAGNLIADAKMRKVFAADDYSAIAIAGAAGQAVEMVKLFQLELEHYEKITGDRLSLEGKANRLAQMIRGNFPLAMQGLVVVPLFGGYDHRRNEGRIFYYDATGGRWEEDDYQTTGSGSQPAKNSLKKRWRAGLSRDDALRVAAEALIDAAEDDSATGGPDAVRGIWPVMVIVTAEGASDVPESEVAAAVDAVLAESGGPRHELHALRRARADDEGPVRLRAQGHRARSIGARPRVRRRPVVPRREPEHHPAQDQRGLRPRRVRRRGQVQRVRGDAHRRHPAGRPARLPVRPRGREGARPGERVLPGAVVDLHAADEALRDRAAGRRGRRRRERHARSTTSCSTARSPTSRATWRWAATPRNWARR